MNREEIAQYFTDIREPTYMEQQLLDILNESSQICSGCGNSVEHCKLIDNGCDGYTDGY